MSDREHDDELESSVAAWVLGALEPEEAAAIGSHVEACPICREVASRLRRVVGALPLAVEGVAPPARLRGGVLAAAAASRERAVAPATARIARPRAALPRVSILAAVGRRMPIYALAAVALVALLIGVLVGQIAFRGAQPAPSSQVARFTLVGHDGMSGAQAAVVDLKTDGVALVDFRGLPPAGANRVYELWLIPARGNPVPAAVFVPDSNGAKVVLVNRSLSGYTTMAVTNEPGPDGSHAPTQPPQLYGSVG